MLRAAASGKASELLASTTWVVFLLLLSEMLSLRVIPLALALVISPVCSVAQSFVYRLLLCLCPSFIITIIIF